MKLKNKFVFYSLIILSILFLGYYREFVFKNINALMQAWDHDMDYRMPSTMRFLESFEYDSLKNAKWFLTLFVAALYLLLTFVTIRFVFKNKNFNRIVLGIYIGLTIVSAFFILIGIVFSSGSEKMYESARYLMGIAQSPVVLMILIPAFKLATAQNDLIKK